MVSRLGTLLYETMNASMNVVPGTKLGRYEIRSKIGEGGMGEVYLAQDIKLDRKVALKIFPAELTCALISVLLI